MCGLADLRALYHARDNDCLLMRELVVQGSARRIRLTVDDHERGVRVLRCSAALRRAGLRPSMVISAVNGIPVRTHANAISVVNACNDEKRIMRLIVELPRRSCWAAWLAAAFTRRP